MEQRSEAWFKARQGRITASLVGGLLDCAPYMTKEDAYRTLVRSCHGLSSEFEGNIATEYGTANEPLALAAYEMNTGRDVEQVGFVPFENWAGCSPDGLIGADGLLEIKCPFGKRKDEKPVFKSYEQQPHYYAQMQFQMFCTSRQWCAFFQWSAHGNMLEKVVYDPSWINENLPKLKALWHKAQDENPADFDGPKRQVIDTPEAVRLVAEYDELQEAIDNATDRKKDIIARMAEMSGDKDAEIAGRKFTLVKRVGSVAYSKALKELLPDADLEPYRDKPSEGWRLT